ncbi:TadE/TadG family type IV pilus assembly protein [Yersinia sp. Marseille-Q3913]|uniref:TadE/TadG family type IV pilus assembly protein n=1 Tax=Yersinia sp. Marseille-Q3913 TaxID=2830769 RepID=UPI001BB04AD9|nr:TadE/TadG family type IV pilus assembly protein [Yersinia sp. Marseille-Q3913]MBS0054011.1 pilus assembly protein [Yersinia sp. Marseille-Q3913]
MLTNKSVRPTYHKYSSLLLKKHQGFIKSEKGAILLPFIVLLPLFIGLLFLSFEISHFLQKKAKLSDAIEQATLALTVENDDLPDEVQMSKNADLVSHYSRAYLPLEHFSVPVIDIKNNSGQLVYNAKITMSYFANFLSKTAMTNTITTIGTEDNGAARKNIPLEKNNPTDVIFVADYSGSMSEEFNENDFTGSRIAALRDIFTRLDSSALQNTNIHTIGFIPFSWGTKRIVMNNKEEIKYCHFPFVPKIYKSDNSYLRQYTVSELKKIPGLEGLIGIDDIKYAELTAERFAYINSEIEKRVKHEDIDKVKELLNQMYDINNPAVQIKIIEDMIDYDATIKSINSVVQHIDIPLDDILYDSLCLRNSSAYSLDNYNSHHNFIDKMINMSPEGHTLASSGILYANSLFMKESKNNNNKLMIIISDGDDSVFSIDNVNHGEQLVNITKKLIDNGMCEKIKENNIKMVFIAIAYSPDDIKSTEHQIDWRKCVGEDNYYEAYNANELEADLQKALRITTTSEVGRNIPKH